MLIGIDIVDIERVKKAVERNPRFLKRVFTPNELEYCMGKNNPYPSLAARFAAKEALRKLHPFFSKGIKFHEVEVVRDSGGRPNIVLYGNALLKKRQAGIENLSLSLSHAKYQAVAAVIATKGVGENEDFESSGDERN
ncbi:holo-ACP synthase [Thermosyntropha sp.]|uniref:holo-ACP synthase n=1 Tax=Thermosyntropha sp. TaxID=2740820 RepID=UPI0025CF1ED0|nr:holo-ACP synthase [Thermosyntropha sp.]MBO8158244.1 holo-ACP synthase [Thermosyntropha sp.]